MVHLVTNDRLLLGGKVLEGRQKARSIFRTPDKIDKLAELFGECMQNLVLVLGILCFHFANREVTGKQKKKKRPGFAPAARKGTSS